MSALLLDTHACDYSRAAILDWWHCDPFDRFIAANAMELRYRLVSRDVEFDVLNGMTLWSGRVWS